MRKPLFFWICLGVGLLIALAIVLGIAGRERSPVNFAQVEVKLGPVRTKTQISVNWQTAFLIAPDGSLWWWGQESLPVVYFKGRPQRLGMSDSWVAVAAAFQFGVALKTDGSLWQFGENPFIASTNPPLAVTSPPRPILPGTRWRSVAAGQGHVLAIREDGSLWAWGANWQGPLGDGTTTPSAVPVQVGTNTNWISIAANQQTSFAVKSDGTLWQWGWLGWDQVAGTPITVMTPAQMGTNADWVSVDAQVVGAVCRKRDGTYWRVSYWASGPIAKPTISTNTATPLLIGRDFIAVTDSPAGSFALKPDGTLWTWDATARLRTNAPTLHRWGRRTDWRTLVGSASHTQVGLTADGQVWEWGIVIGLPERETPWSALNKFLKQRFKFVLGGAVSYPTVKEPFVLMRFTTNSPAAVESK